MSASVTAGQAEAQAAVPRDWRRYALYLLLGFAAGLPFYMFNAVLLLRLARHGVDIVTVGYFAWVALLPTFKFAWAPLLDRYDVPGFGRFWGKRRGWIMLAQLGIFLSMVAMAFTSADHSLPVVALFAVLLAFWTTTLEVAADAWRIEIAPTAEEQGPMVAANLWGYRSAMVAAGSGAIFIAAKADWTWAYLVIAVAAFLPFPILAAMRPDPGRGGGRLSALATGLGASAIVLGGSLIVTAVVGWALLAAIGSIGINNPSVVSYWVFGIALLPFVAIAAAVPWIRDLPPTAPARMSAAIGPYVDVAWRYGYMLIPVLLFVSVYRMGDVMALTLSHPLFNALGYSLEAISFSDGAVALVSSMLGVALGGWLAARARMGWALAIGALMSALSNWIFAWLAHQHPGGPALFSLGSWVISGGDFKLYLAMGVDQFGHGFEGAVFVVYLSMLVNPRFPGAQYALLSGLAFLLPRLLAGLSGVFQQSIGYAGFFIMAGAMSLGAVVFLPLTGRAVARPDDHPEAA
ncbi:permease [Sphingomonas sp.]|jgi:PAT family beta-lactamase induction signal transducer AmpG|uniref:permease n=1 Tax=Sphingomonas sp. TaxID=28214 RepID=UPI002E35E00B|nr:permease [Sphingomonas sp.]HEX4694560.1 permease [Sphingomonas sp.]